MEYRTWITEALRLHVEEHLPRVVAGRRLGVPKSTVCGLFARFRKSGLSWPLPAGMLEQELDARLYERTSTVPVIYPERTVMSETPVVKKRPRRPNFPYEFKIALVEQSLQPGACVAQIARENGINDNMLFNWRHQYLNGKRSVCNVLNRPGFPGEYFICKLRLPDHYFRWKHNKLFLLLPEEYGPAFPAIVDCYTSPPTLVWPVPLLSGFSSSYGVLPPLCKDH